MKGKQLLGTVLLAVVLSTAYTAIINWNTSKSAQEHIDNFKKYKSLDAYYIAKGETLKLNNPDMKVIFEQELQASYQEVFTDNVMKVMDALSVFNVRKDLLTYNELMNDLIPKVENKKSREYLKNEVYTIGENAVYTPETLRAVNTISKAWADKYYIKQAEKEIVNNLAYKNLWTMYYLQAQLNELKYSKSDKKKILIIGDSITNGMGASYKGDKGNAEIQNAWWQYIDQIKYDIMFLAVGGMGVIQQGLINNFVSDSGFDMLKYAEKVSKMGKDYDKIVIALSTNDYVYSDYQYERALGEMLEYMQKNYRSKEYILLNFYNHEDAMKSAAKDYSAKFIDVDMTKIDKFNPAKDDIHPSAKGQRQIYEAVKESFR
jgi:lysophospholipase L1-like esterase